jgi:hypothetical protein
VQAEPQPLVRAKAATVWEVLDDAIEELDYSNFHSICRGRAPIRAAVIMSGWLWLRDQSAIE